MGSPLEVFPLKSGVAILGGFAGLGAIDPNARDTERHETILSGDLRGNDVDFWGPENADVYGEFFRAGQQPPRGWVPQARTRRPCWMG